MFLYRQKLSVPNYMCLISNTDRTVLLCSVSLFYFIDNKTAELCRPSGRLFLVLMWLKLYFWFFSPRRTVCPETGAYGLGFVRPCVRACVIGHILDMHVPFSFKLGT